MPDFIARFPHPRPHSRCARGFTLIELLVAIGIMALVAIISWRGLSSLMATRDRIGPDNDDLRALLTTFGQMQLDLSQAVNPVLLPVGAAAVAVDIVDGSPQLRIVRVSAPLPDGASAIQQVVYAVRDGSLVRQATDPSRTVTTGADAAIPLPAPLRLVPTVASMRVRTWRANEGWVVPAQADPTRPPGVEVEITRSDGTTLRRVMRVG